MIGRRAAWRYSGSKYKDMYQVEHDELFASIRARKPINDGIRMAHSTLTAIMGRMSAYTGKVVTWEQALNSAESLVPARLEWGPMPVPPIARPGQMPPIEVEEKPAASSARKS